MRQTFQLILYVAVATVLTACCTTVLGTAMWHAGRQDEGMAKLDSVIALLSAKQPFKFNELDALIIALWRSPGGIRFVAV